MNASRSSKPRPAAPAPRLEKRREEILDAAIHHFAANGYADTDLQVLADDLGIGKGTLYRHFGSKEKLFLAAADRVMRNLRISIDDSIRDIADPIERIVRAIHAYLEYFDRHPEGVEMLIQERAQFKDRKKPTFFEHREANTARWQAVYRDLIAAGRIRPLDVERITNVLGDLVYGTMFVTYMAGRRRTPAQAAAEIIDIAFHGILSDSERQAWSSRLATGCRPQT